MYIGRVTGTVVATIHHPTFDGRKLLIVTRLDLAGKISSDYDIAVDLVQAGVGDVVLVLDEGGSARLLTGTEPNGAVRAVIVGIVDEVEVQ
ncbi:MAG: EutN/CcmL family microcompartment protein [Anaerolineae bacterium]